MIYLKQAVGWLAVLGLAIMGYKTTILLWPQDWLMGAFAVMVYCLVGLQWISNNFDEIIDEMKRRAASQ